MVIAAAPRRVGHVAHRSCLALGAVLVLAAIGVALPGCGDCIDDYEGISGHQAYRGDLRLLYFASLETGTGQLAALRMAPMRARKMRLDPAPAADRQWLSAVRLPAGLAV